MTLNLKSLTPWNWLKKEQNGTTEIVRADDGLSPVLRLHREMDQLFDQILRGMTGRSSLPIPSFPKMDISETDTEYHIEAETPGLQRGDVEVTVEDDTLILRGRCERQEEEKGRHFHRVERAYGSFERYLSLPSDANVDAIDARLENGVLRVRIQKRPEKSRSQRQIPVN